MLKRLSKIFQKERFQKERKSFKLSKELKKGYGDPSDAEYVDYMYKEANGYYDDYDPISGSEADVPPEPTPDEIFRELLKK